MFYDRLNLLCKQHGTSITEVTVMHLGVANSTATSWKKGAVPRCDVVIRAAQHFNVTADYLLGLSDDPSPAQPTDDAERAIRAAADQLRRAPAPARIAALASVTAILHALDDTN